MSANHEVRELANSGNLKALHSRYNELKGRVETEYLAVRDQLAKII